MALYFGPIIKWGLKKNPVFLMPLQIPYRFNFTMQKQYKSFLLLSKNQLSYAGQNTKKSPNSLIDTINQPNFREIRLREIVDHEKPKYNIKRPGKLNVCGQLWLLANLFTV